jgi:2-iminobutanoate/2-iminopropanoate deaminase
MMMKTTITAVMIAASIAAAASSDESRYIVDTRSATRAALPFSDAVWAGNTLYVSGHIAIDPKTERAPPDSALEAKMVLDAVKATVEHAGLSMDDLVSVTVYCSDLGLYDAFNTVYKTYFHGGYPARAFIGVAQLLRGAHFEVQGIAARLPEPPKK